MASRLYLFGQVAFHLYNPITTFIKSSRDVYKIQWYSWNKGRQRFRVVDRIRRDYTVEIHFERFDESITKRSLNLSKE
jgi:hypothetical protein